MRIASLIHVGGALALCVIGLLPAFNTLTVIYARGWHAFESGVRVMPIKPPQFNDGVRVPHDAAVKAIFTTGGILVVYIAVPPLLFPRAFLRREAAIRPRT